MKSTEIFSVMAVQVGSLKEGAGRALLSLKPRGETVLHVSCLISGAAGNPGGSLACRHIIHSNLCLLSPSGLIYPDVFASVSRCPSSCGIKAFPNDRVFT